jgi:ribose transport system substrate-binding protein
MSFALALGYALVLPGGGCEKAQKPGSPAKPKIALVMKSLANEFFSTMAEGAQEAPGSETGKLIRLLTGLRMKPIWPNR